MIYKKVIDKNKKLSYNKNIENKQIITTAEKSIKQRKRHIMTTIEKIVDGNVWYVAEEDTQKTKKSVFNIPIKIRFDETKFEYRTLCVFRECSEMSLKDASINSVIEYKDRVYLIATHCGSYANHTVCYPLFHTRSKKVRYNPQLAITLNKEEKITFLTNTFEHFCDMYKKYGKV